MHGKAEKIGVDQMSISPDNPYSLDDLCSVDIAPKRPALLILCNRSELITFVHRSI